MAPVDDGARKFMVGTRTASLSASNQEVIVLRDTARVEQALQVRGEANFDTVKLAANARSLCCALPLVLPRRRCGQ